MQIHSGEIDRLRRTALNIFPMGKSVKVLDGEAPKSGTIYKEQLINGIQRAVGFILKGDVVYIYPRCKGQVLYS